MAKNNELDYQVLNDILDRANYYNDKINENKFYVEYEKKPGVLCFEPLDSEEFESFVGAEYRKQTQQRVVPYIETELKIRKQDLLVNGNSKVSVCKRLSGSISEGRILYFLADEDRNIVRIEKEEIVINNDITDTDVRFLKNKVDLPQVEPKDAEDESKDLLTLLRPYVNLNDDAYKLFVITLVHYFCRESSHFAMILSSQKGSGKSTLSRLVRRLVEPSEAGITLTSNSENDLKTTLAGNYVVCFDNTDTLSANFSNILCGAITGAKDVKRKLYTDFEQVVLELHNVVIVNGVDIIPWRSDLAERSLLFSLEKITKKNRRTDNEFWTNFKQDHPYILGEIFKTLQKAIQIYPTMEGITKLHRMADANREMLAIAEALGISREECQNLIDKNEEEMKRVYSEFNPFVDIVVEFFQKQGTTAVEMRGSDLYQAIYDFIPGNKKFFPQSSPALSRKLNEERDMLEMSGIRFSKRSDNKGTFLKLERIPDKQLSKEQKEHMERQEQLREAAAGTSEDQTPQHTGFKKLDPKKVQEYSPLEDDDDAPADSGSSQPVVEGTDTNVN